MNKVARQVRRAPQDLDRPEVAGQTALTKLAQEADAMHALLVLRAALMGCTEGSEEEEELSAITDALKRTKPSAGRLARSQVAKGKRGTSVERAIPIAR